MYKYVKFNEESGLCTEVGEGTNTEFYKSVGMVRKDVEQSEVDNQWYLTSKCPHYTDEEIAEKEALEQEQAKQRENELALADLKDRMATADLLGDDEWKAELRAEYLELMEEE